MRGDAKVQAVAARGRFQFADDVALRPHLGGVPIGKARVVHGEAVAMLGYRNYIARAGLREEIEPRIGVEMLRAKHGDEVLIAEFRLRPVGCDVVFERGSALHIHVARVPFVSECRNGIHAPVDEDAELGVAKPVGYAIAGERIPIGAERAGARGRVDAR